jgi:hypothetical protein
VSHGWLLGIYYPFTNSRFVRQGPHPSVIRFSCKWLEIANAEEHGMGRKVGIMNVCFGGDHELM